MAPRAVVEELREVDEREGRVRAALATGAIAAFTVGFLAFLRWVDPTCEQRGGRLVHVEDAVSHRYEGRKLVRITTPIYECVK